MTPQEQELLTSLTEKINQTQLEEKDPDAENLLGRELGANPDAIYILAQTVLVQNIALDQAKTQIAQLQQQLQQARPQPAHATSFLGRLLGERDEPAPPAPPRQGSGSWGGQRPPGYQPVPQYSQPQYAPPPPPQYLQQYPQQQYVPVQSGQPSFLRGAMQTAAGVAAGALAFEGVESILNGFGHGFEHGGGYGMTGMGMGPGMGLGGGFERPVEETVINNYYDGPGRVASITSMKPEIRAAEPGSAMPVTTPPAKAPAPATIGWATTILPTWPITAAATRRASTTEADLAGIPEVI